MNWYDVANVGEIPSPSLLLFRDRIEANLEMMLQMAGGPERLRPHVKTHKIPELVRRQVELGITKFKTATVAEAEMAAVAGALDVLLAYQPVGPQVRRWIELVRRFPATRFRCLVDDATALRELSVAAVAAATTLDVLVDLDVGQHRTGREPGEPAVELYRALTAAPGLSAGGLHAYDGHIHHTDVAARTAACDAAFAPVERLRRRLVEAGLAVPRVVAGGTPTFPMHGRRAGVELSPGTCVLWDAGYGRMLPDLAFVPAAVLLTRVVSRPGKDRLCLDLGHKAVASEMPHPRAVLLELPDAVPVMHNEEHLVIETPLAEHFRVGDVLRALPWHVCPTVALHETAFVVTLGRVTGEWRVVARARRLTI